MIPASAPLIDIDSVFEVLEKNGGGFLGARFKDRHQRLVSASLLDLLIEIVRRPRGEWIGRVPGEDGTSMPCAVPNGPRKPVRFVKRNHRRRRGARCARLDCC